LQRTIESFIEAPLVELLGKGVRSGHVIVEALGERIVLRWGPK
jgi:hypothetical protein